MTISILTKPDEPNYSNSLQPNFLSSRCIDLSIATSDYCQARCNNCIWPYMEKQNKVLSVEDFQGILNKFSGFTIGELALNIINEPFTDKTILKKLKLLSEIQKRIDVLFFSSNWLIPEELALDEFADSIKKCAGNPSFGKIHLNATVSGIDDRSYDIQQAGVDLVNTIAPYRKLDFNRAVNNIRGVIKRISGIPDWKKIKFRIKAYGNAFTKDEMQSFWLHILVSSGVPADFINRHVKIMLNEGYTTFARSFDGQSNMPLKRCAHNWLDRRLVVGPQGEVGLCCEDGLNSVVVGNILDQELSELVANESFQLHLAKVTGFQQASLGDPCLRCSFFEAIE